ncbi:MAG: PASTA domain-containing protein [Cytophagaceae bacterium]|jgi:beta-lactam-binding protein with PASTA domain|nr:PASTA domain-containing protein [Cytophagaceae bacterium]
MKWWKIFITKAFWKNLGIIVLIAIFLIIAAFFSLNLYTRHGNSKPLPDFTGLTEAQLQRLIQNNQWRYTVVDSVHLADVPKGVVIEQVPKAGEHVKKNRNIFFTINAWDDEQVSIPNLQDYSLRNAKALLESYGLAVGELIYIPSEYTNLVLGQHLNGKPVVPGTLVSKGTVVDLLIGRGLSSKLTAVPNLMGLERPIAEQVATSLGLNLGAIIFDGSVVSPDDSAKAFVWRQTPTSASGAMLNIGASINVWLTLNDSLLRVNAPALDDVPTDVFDDDNAFESEFQ